MADIKFARDYGYAPAAPFWLVWNEAGRAPLVKHPSRDDAEQEAARLAAAMPGASFHVLTVMSTISTNIEVVGSRFDPNRTPPRVEQVENESPTVAEPVPAFINDTEPF